MICSAACSACTGAGAESAVLRCVPDVRRSALLSHGMGSVISTVKVIVVGAHNKPPCCVQSRRSKVQQHGSQRERPRTNSSAVRVTASI